MVVCCSASRLEHGDADQYVQGAGDDTENWAHGLTAELFWQHRDELMLERGEEEVVELVEELVRQKRSEDRTEVVEVWPRGCKRPFYIGTQSGCRELERDFDAVVLCEDFDGPVGPYRGEKSKHLNTMILRMGCLSGKLGSKALRESLLVLKPFMGQVLARTQSPRILITCSTGKDISVGVALALFCLYYDDQGMGLCNTLK